MNVGRFVVEWSSDVAAAFRPVLKHLREAGYSTVTEPYTVAANYPVWSVGIAKGRRFRADQKDIRVALKFIRTSDPDEVEVFYIPELDIGTIDGHDLAGKSLADEVFMLGNDYATREALEKLSEQGPWIVNVLENYEFPTPGVMEWRPELE